MGNQSISLTSSEQGVTITLGTSPSTIKPKVPSISFTEIVSFFGIILISIICLAEYSETMVVKSDIVPVISTMEKVGIKFPYIVLAQFIRETTYKGKPFNSPIAKNNSNLCGMKMNKRGLALRKERGHAFYANKLDNLKDYQKWQARMMKNYPYPLETEADYYWFLEHLPITKECNTHYAEDTGYVSAVKSIREQLRFLEQN